MLPRIVDILKLPASVLTPLIKHSRLPKSVWRMVVEFIVSSKELPKINDLVLNGFVKNADTAKNVYGAVVQAMDMVIGKARGGRPTKRLPVQKSRTDSHTRYLSLMMRERVYAAAKQIDDTKYIAVILCGLEGYFKYEYGKDFGDKNRSRGGLQIIEPRYAVANIIDQFGEPKYNYKGLREVVEKNYYDVETILGITSLGGVDAEFRLDKALDRFGFDYGWNLQDELGNAKTMKKNLINRALDEFISELRATINMIKTPQVKRAKREDLYLNYSIIRHTLRITYNYNYPKMTEAIMNSIAKDRTFAPEPSFDIHGVSLKPCR